MNAALAQLVERSLSKRKVAGSSPACGSIFFQLKFDRIYFKAQSLKFIN